MDRIMQWRPSPAMAVALVALFVALGGVALAGEKSIKTGDPAGGDLSGTYPDPSIAGDAVDSGKVANDSLTGDDIAESTLGGVAPAGAAGGDLTGTYPNPDIASGAVGTSEIAAGAVGTSDIGTIPAARATKTNGSPQSIPNGTSTTVSLNSEATADDGFDTANMHDNAVNNSRLTAPVGGTYLASAEVGWQVNGTGDRILTIVSSSASGGAGGAIAQDVDGPVSSANTGLQSTSGIARLSAGDYVYMDVHQNSGGNLNVLADTSDYPFLSLVWLGP